MLSEADYPAAEADYTDYADEVPELAEPETADDAAYVDAEDPDADYAREAYPDDEYPDVAVPRTPSDTDAVTGALETAEPEDDYLDVATSEPDVESGTDTAAAADVADAVVAGAVAAGTQARSGRHAAADDAEDGSENGLAGPDGRPTIHLPLDDPYQAPDGYPIKASARYGLYYTPGSDLYQDTLAEIWLSSEEVALANGFTRAD
jgi:uncharacterized protein with LGFP repeats